MEEYKGRLRSPAEGTAGAAAKWEWSMFGERIRSCKGIGVSETGAGFGEVNHYLYFAR